MRFRISRLANWGLLVLSLLGVLSLFTDPIFSRIPSYRSPTDYAASPLQAELSQLGRDWPGAEMSPSAADYDSFASSDVAGNARLKETNVLQENLDMVKQNPDVIKQNPDVIKQNPDTVKQNPNMVKEIPNMVKENSDKDPHRRLPEDRNSRLERQAVVIAPHPNIIAGAGIQQQQRQEAAPDNRSSPLVAAYDWTTIRLQYFRGDKIPDDMLAMKPPRYLSQYKNPCFYLRDPEHGDVTLPGGLKARLKCLPYFHLIGVDKSGTTDLWYRLTQHKHVARNSGVLGKETHWWSWRRFGFDIWIRNAPIRHFDWYLSHFDVPAKKIRETAAASGNLTVYPVITGEGSPTVFWDFTGWDLIPQNVHSTPEKALVTPSCIRHLTPDVKLIVMLRNPVDRLFSEYLFLDRFKSRHNVSAQLFHEGVVRSIAMLEDCVKQHSFHACLYNKSLHMVLPVRIMVGMYSVWLKQWLKVFPREQMLILRNEDYARHMETHLTRVFDFLGLSRLSETEMQRVATQQRAFQRSQKERAVGDMLPATRQILTERFQPYNKELANLLADPSFLWQ